jgi:phosphohistidine phosphatase
MDLYFLRHGLAGSAHAWRGDDADRPLTDKGRELAERVAERLSTAGVVVESIVTSPYARAAQTAEITAGWLLPSGIPLCDEALRPGFDRAALAGILERHAGVSSLMLVGHESDFSTVIGQLLGSAEMVLRKSGVAMVEMADPAEMRARLMWMVPPSLLV